MRFRGNAQRDPIGRLDRHASARPRVRQLSRRMARPISEPRGAVRRTGSGRGRGTAPLALIGAALVVLVAVLGVYGLLGRPAPSGESAVDAAAVPTRGNAAVVDPAAASNAASGDQAAGSPTPRAAATDAPAAARPTPTASRPPFSAPTASRDPNAAPRNASEFDLAEQAIDILFPLEADARYRYRDNFMLRRAGEPAAHNHARLSSDGRYVRLHDGIDVYGPAGALVLAPFSGEVIDPETRWRPWDRARYGVTVVVISDEPLSAGYAAVMVHLDRAEVNVGDHVQRGEVIGMLGVSGNAEGDGIHPHLHFELRAPFALDWSQVGVDSQVDAFNPFPSLVRADPKR